MMKTHKILATLLFSILFFASCEKSNSKTCDFVTVTVTNDLSADIDMLTINGVSFPLLAGQTTDEICFDQINLDPNIPVVPFEALIGSDTCFSMYTFYCGVGMVLHQSGTHNIKLAEVIPADAFVPCHINYEI